MCWCLTDNLVYFFPLDQAKAGRARPAETHDIVTTKKYDASYTQPYYREAHNLVHPKLTGVPVLVSVSERVLKCASQPNQREQAVPVKPEAFHGRDPSWSNTTRNTVRHPHGEAQNLLLMM